MFWPIRWYQKEPGELVLTVGTWWCRTLAGPRCGGAGGGSTRVMGVRPRCGTYGYTMVHLRVTPRHRKSSKFMKFIRNSSKSHQNSWNPCFPCRNLVSGQSEMSRLWFYHFFMFFMVLTILGHRTETIRCTSSPLTSERPVSEMHDTFWPVVFRSAARVIGVVVTGVNSLQNVLPSVVSWTVSKTVNSVTPLGQTGLKLSVLDKTVKTDNFAALWKSGSRER